MTGDPVHQTSEADRYDPMQRAHADQRDGTKRRDVLRWTGALLQDGSSARPAKSARKNEAAFAGLREKDPMDVEMSCVEMVEKAHRLGHDYEARHGDCCRCTVAALQSAIKFVPNDKGLFRAASCLDGGFDANWNTELRGVHRWGGVYRLDVWCR